MTTLAFQQRQARVRTVTEDGFEPPPYALRNMPDISELPKDDLDRDIVVFLAENPEIQPLFDAVDLNSMSGPEKIDLLDRIRTILGIRPTRNRRLGYVGPDVSPSSIRRRHLVG